MCLNCDTKLEPVTRMQMDTMMLNIEGLDMPLKIAVPVTRCQSCHFQWTDHRAEKIRGAVHKIYYPEVGNDG